MVKKFLSGLVLMEENPYLGVVNIVSGFGRIRVVEIRWEFSKRFKRNYSSQAMHKKLGVMVDSGVLIKRGLYYSISRDFARFGKKFYNELYDRTKKVGVGVGGVKNS